jgi:hypothetical protein
MKPPRLFVMAPAFAVPLNNDELMILGYIGLVWGQIDFLTDQILCFVYAFDKEQRDRFLSDKMMATKVDWLAKDLVRLPDELHDDTKRFVEMIQATKQLRNGAFHGVWGWRWLKRSRTREVAAWHGRMLKNPIKPAHLEKLAYDLADCANLGNKIMCVLYEFPYSPQAQFTWDGGIDGPDWLDRGRFRKGRSPTDRKQPKSGSPPTIDPDPTPGE